MYWWVSLIILLVCPIISFLEWRKVKDFPYRKAGPFVHGFFWLIIWFQIGLLIGWLIKNTNFLPLN